LRQRIEEAVAQHAREGHRHMRVLACGEREADILEAERQRKAGGLIALFGDDRAIALIDRRGE